MSPSSRTPGDPVEWVSRLPHGLAVFTAETVAFLWFSTSLSLSSHTLSNPSSPLPTNLPSRIIHPISPSPSVPPASSSPLTLTSLLSPPPPVALHLWPSQEFVDFVENVLKTTQVSAQVVLLAIMLVDRFKAKSETTGERGSEMRLFVVGLVLANKTLDDSAYTNKTWSEVTHIDLQDLNRMERQFLGGLRFDLWTSSPEWKAWLQRLDDLQTLRSDAILAFRPHQTLSFPPGVQLTPLLPSSSHRPSSSSSVPFPSYHHPSVDPALQPYPPPPVNVTYPSSYAQRPLSSHQQQQRIPQMSMAELQIGSHRSAEQQAMDASYPNHLTRHSSQPAQQQAPYPYPSINIPPASFPTLQSLQSSSQPRSAPVYNAATAPFFPPASHHPATIPTIFTPRGSSKKRPAGDAFSSPPQPSNLDTFPPSKRQHRASFDSSTISTPSNSHMPPQQTQALPREVMAAMTAGPSNLGSGESMFPGAHVGFGGQVSRGGGSGVQWPSMQDYVPSGPNALYAPYVYQARDANGVVQLYVKTVAASPLSWSPSYQNYRKAQLKVQPAPMISHQPSSSSSQPRFSSNLSQPPQLYSYPEPHTDLYPTQAVLRDQAAAAAGLANQVSQVISGPSSSSRPQSGLVDRSTPSADSDFSRLERWRRSVVSSPPVVPEEGA